MRFQRGPVMAYVAVVLIGLLVIIQTLSPDTSSLHRVPRTLSGQADFTVVPPAPDPDVSGVSTIPSTPSESDSDEDGDQDKSSEPNRPSGEKPDPKPSTPADEQPETPPSQQPEEPPADPGEGEGEDDPVAPPTLLPPMGPVPGIMAPLLWPFVAEEDARPIDEAVPMFLRQLIAADAGVPVDALPLKVPEKEPETKEQSEETPEPKKDPTRGSEAESEAEQIAEDACEFTAAIVDGVKTLPRAGAAKGTKDDGVEERRATPECAQACAEPESPVRSSPAADPKVSTDPAVPSGDASPKAPKTEQKLKDGREDEKTCAEKSVQ